LAHRRLTDSALAHRGLAHWRLAGRARLWQRLHRPLCGRLCALRAGRGWWGSGCRRLAQQRIGRECLSFWQFLWRRPLWELLRLLAVGSAVPRGRPLRRLLRLVVVLSQR
jgi:hypothetical protein